jgi:PPP family 3-phenylpropionic acid transporter
VLVGVVCLFISHNVLNTFPYQIIQPLGGDSGQMGTMLLIQSLVELPVMFLFSWLLTKGSSRLWVKLAGVGFFLHALGAWLAPNMGVMYVVQIFEMPGYALYALASVYWVNETVAPGQRVQGQAWFTMAITLGSVLASFLGGFLLDWGGAEAILLFAVFTGGLGMVLLLALLGKNSSTMTAVSSV